MDKLSLEPLTSTVSDADREAAREALQSPSVLQPWHCAAFNPYGHDGWHLTPETPLQVAQLLAFAAEAKNPLTLTASDAVRLEEPVWLDVKNLTNIRKHAALDFVITVETGITLGALQAFLKPHGQHWPFSYPDGLTLLEILAQDLPALEAGRFGYPRDFVLGVEIATPDGDITHAGGEVVKNVTGYDLNKLYVGSQNTLGVLTAVTLKLKPLPVKTTSYLAGFCMLAEALQALEVLQEQPYFSISCCELLQPAQLPVAFQMEAGLTATDTWCLYLRCDGAAENLLERLPAMHRLTAETESRLTKLLTVLMADPIPEPVLLEAALPPAALGQFLKNFQNSLASLPNVPSPEWQVRPMAGLVYAHWAAEALPSVDAFNTLCTVLDEQLAAVDGVLQLLRFPPNFQPIATRLNLPAYLPLRTLMADLKRAYDPTGVLVSHRLPLGLPNPVLPEAIATHA